MNNHDDDDEEDKYTDDEVETVDDGITRTLLVNATGLVPAAIMAVTGVDRLSSSPPCQCMSTASWITEPVIMERLML